MSRTTHVPRPVAVAMIRAHLIELAAATCAALGLPVAARHVSEGRYQHASRNLLAAARRTTDRERAKACRSLHNGVLGLEESDDPYCGPVYDTVLAARMMAHAATDPVTSAAIYWSDRRNIHLTYCDEYDRLHDRGIALRAWKAMPESHRLVALTLLEEMPWRRALEVATWTVEWR